MGLFGQIANGVRAAARDVTDDRWFGGTAYAIGGRRVTAATAAQAGAVLPMVGLVAETLGSLPLEFRNRDNVTNERPYRYAELLSEQPNPLMTGPEFWATFAFNAVLRGRAYAEPTMSADGLEVWPLRPIQLNELHGERTFGVDYWYDDGRSRHFGAGELLTGTGISPDGVSAVVPWAVAATAIEMADVLEAFGRNFFRNGARPSGVLSTDNPLSADAVKRLSEQFNGNFAGVLNAGKVPVLEQGLKYLAITPPNTDSQYLELRRNQVRELARNWRVPLHMIGEGEDSKNDEQKSLEFVKYTLRPWLRRFEKAVARDLMTPADRSTWAPHFNLDALLRGDSATQHRNAVLARTSSTHTINDLRVNWFGLPRIAEDWADDPRTPLNSNRAADTQEGGMTAPQDRSDA